MCREQIYWIMQAGMGKYVLQQKLCLFLLTVDKNFINKVTLTGR